MLQATALQLATTSFNRKPSWAEPLRNSWQLMQLTHCNCNDCSCNYNKHKECAWKRSFRPARLIATSPKARSATAEREHRNGTGRERERKTAHLRLQTAATNRIQLPSTLVTCSGCSLSAITSCTSCAAVAQQQAATRRTRSVRWRMQRWLQLTLPRILRQKVKQRGRERERVRLQLRLRLLKRVGACVCASIIVIIPSTVRREQTHALPLLQQLGPLIFTPIPSPPPPSHGFLLRLVAFFEVFV